MVSCQELGISGVKLITLSRHTDKRGWINESWRDSWSEAIGIPDRFVQDMLSWNDYAFTLRGLHTSTLDQYKLVSILNGKVFDVVVDGRRSSSTYGKYLSVELSKEEPYSLLIPPGCFHGYLTLYPDTAVAYKVSQYHNPETDIGIMWNDPTVGIKWPDSTKQIIISERDRNHPLLKDL